MQGGRSKMQRIVILVAIPVEFQAVRAHLVDIHEEKHKDTKTIYIRGKFYAGDQVWDVILGQTGAGNVQAAVEAERAINYYQPRIIFFIGVAGSLKDAVLGDVVVASRVYAYESGKAAEVYHVRPEVSGAKYAFIQLAEAEARKADWLQRLKKTAFVRTPRVLVAPIVAGENVVASTNSPLYQFLKQNYDHAVAIEMEGHGFYQACYAHPELDALCIRGISDLIDDKKVSDNQNWQAIAASNASAFAFELLAKLDASYLQLQEPDPQQAEGIPPPLSEQTSTDEILHNDMQVFHDAVSRQIVQVTEIATFFGVGHTTFFDQLKRASTMMIGMLMFLDEWADLMARVKHLSNLKISNLRIQIVDIQHELKNFPSVPISTKQIRYYSEVQSRVQEKIGRVLDALEQLKNGE